jgi:hypothetical protein
VLEWGKESEEKRDGGDRSGYWAMRKNDSPAACNLPALFKNVMW